MKETEIHPPIEVSIEEEQSPPTSKRDKITEQKVETKKPKKEGKQWKEAEFRKTRRFNMVLTENEYVSLLQKAQHAKTVTSYILESCLTEKSDKIQPYKMNTELLTELGKCIKPSTLLAQISTKQPSTSIF
jgi:hypothetical protein